ncbi:MAG: peptidase M48, partial [Cyanobacteria bacterium J06555_12]
LASQLNVSAFLEQARMYDDLDRDDWQVTLKKLQSSGRSHPVPVLRAREIDRWEGSQMYRGLMERR